MKDFEENTALITVVGKFQDQLPKAKDACLVMLYGPDLGKRYPLESGQPMIIGRSEKATIYVDRDSVSRHHAQVVMKGNGYVAQDLGSTNGTYVNDTQVKEAPLCDGDLLKIGEVIFKFLSQDNLENVYHEELYKLATMDGLTMVHNKRFFLDCLDREFSRAIRYKRHLSLILLDLDHFKQINDTYGHLAGDYVLKRTARLAQSHVRREDIFARYGGEEFALLLPETDRWQALQIAEKLRQLIESQQIFYDKMNIRVTLSLGVAMAGAETQDAAHLIKEADTYLYHAKRNGRNRVCG
ncbi:MAG TPA: GGDEF domain-containing protein [Myxococcales bacterium]|nr:GGDEF domain-containing protein [Deltaproteobacteria bacterium]MBU49959.1 GGDEF domain-containing protein [Deltaproteobacteria bacterium]HAA54954.1 GGDEF domain-containing protein [Myxococcales bacterium]